MRKYEAFFILDPDMSDEATASANEKLMGVVAANGGAVISNVSWGKKKLAYPVRKHTRGHYILMEFSGEPTLVAELERNMRLDERVLKFITVKLLDFYDPDKEEPVESRPAPRFGDEEEGAVRTVAEEEEAFEDAAERDAEEGAEEGDEEGDAEESD